MSDIVERISLEQCLAHARNVEKIWSLQPGWSQTDNMAIEWRKAEFTIRHLESALKDIAELSAENGAEWASRRAERALTK